MSTFSINRGIFDAVINHCSALPSRLPAPIFLKTKVSVAEGDMEYSASSLSTGRLFSSIVQTALMISEKVSKFLNCASPISMLRSLLLSIRVANLVFRLDAFVAVLTDEDCKVRGVFAPNNFVN